MVNMKIKTSVPSVSNVPAYLSMVSSNSVVTRLLVIRSIGVELPKDRFSKRKKLGDCRFLVRQRMLKSPPTSTSVLSDSILTEGPSLVATSARLPVNNIQHTRIYKIYITLA